MEAMTAIAKELDDLLNRLDPQRAKSLENLVRDALALAAVEPGVNGDNWPEDYFQKTAGAFAGERFERPPQGELPLRDKW